MRPELPESHSEALLALAVVESLPGVQVQRVASCREIWRRLLGRRRIWAKWAMQVRLVKNPLVFCHSCPCSTCGRRSPRRQPERHL